MSTLPPGGGRRTTSLGTGTTRSGTLASGVGGRRKNIPTPVYTMTGTAAGTSSALAVGETVITGNALLLEIGDDILLETGDRLLIEDGSSPGTALGVATVRAIGAAAAAAQGTSAGVAVASGVMDAGATGDKLLLESGDDILMEDGSFLLLDVGGSVMPAKALIEAITGQPLLGAGGEYLVGV